MYVRVGLSTPVHFFAICRQHEAKVSIDAELKFSKGAPIGGLITAMRCPEGETSCTDDWTLEVLASTSDIVITQ